MPRPPAPDTSTLDAPPSADAVARGARVVTAGEIGLVARMVRARVLGRQDAAADRLGVSRGALSDFEHGHGGTHLDVALRVLADLGLDLVLVPRDPALALREPPRTPRSDHAASSR